MGHASILSLSQQLIGLRSDPGNYKELGKALELCLSYLSRFTIERFEKDGVQSVLVYTAKSRPEQFKLILNGHLDVIPGKASQYKPVVKGDKLYGVGSMDMKSNVSALLHSFKHTAEQVSYPLALQLVTDEEIGGFKGTKYQIDQGVSAEFVIAAETTNFDIVNQAKSVTWVKITGPGETAHGAYPWRGKNAVWRMNQFLNDLSKIFPKVTKERWDATVNLAKIETSNTSFNKIPDNCTIWLDVRDIPAHGGNAIQSIKQMMPNDFVMEVIAQEPALDVKETNPFLQKLRKVTTKVIGRDSRFYGAQGSSDARHYARVGIPGVEFGPVGGGIGTDNEWVSIQSLTEYYEVINTYITSL